MDNMSVMKYVTADELGTLNDTELRIFEQVLSNTNISTREQDLADTVGVSRVWFNQVKNSDKIQKLLADVRARMFNLKMSDTVIKALEKLNGLLDSKEEKNILAASKILLDYSAKQTNAEISSIVSEKGIL